MRALVVDDEKFICDLLCQYISSWAKCRAIMEGNSALDEIFAALDSDMPYDFICLDINLAGVDGIEILRRVREKEDQIGIERGKGTKMIMITSSYDSGLFFESHRYGCEAFLNKPILKEDLEYKLQALGLIS